MLIGWRSMRVDGLITDIRLQPRSGWDLARTARDRQPYIAVIYISGDRAAEWKMRGVRGDRNSVGSLARQNG